MLSPAQIQFRLLTPEAQHAAVHRLALRGCDVATISERTGMAEADVKRYLDVGQTGTPLVRHFTLTHSAFS